MAIEAPDIDTVMAQRQVSALESQTVAQFASVRALAGSADSSFTFGSRTLRPSNAAEGDRFFATDIGARGGFLYVWNGVQWELVVGVASGINAERSAYIPDATDNGGIFWTTDTGKLWEVAGGLWVDRFVSLDATTSYKVNGTKVVGAQGAAVADASGGAVIDVEARAQLNLLLARLRAHGLIA